MDGGGLKQRTQLENLYPMLERSEEGHIFLAEQCASACQNLFTVRARYAVHPT